MSVRFTRDRMCSSPLLVIPTLSNISNNSRFVRLVRDASPWLLTPHLHMASNLSLQSAERFNCGHDLKLMFAISNDVKLLNFEICIRGSLYSSPCPVPISGQIQQRDSNLVMDKIASKPWLEICTYRISSEVNAVNADTCATSCANKPSEGESTLRQINCSFAKSPICFIESQLCKSSLGLSSVRAVSIVRLESHRMPWTMGVADWKDSIRSFVRPEICLMPSSAVAAPRKSSDLRLVKAERKCTSSPTMASPWSCTRKSDSDVRNLLDSVCSRIEIDRPSCCAGHLLQTSRHAMLSSTARRQSVQVKRTCPRSGSLGGSSAKTSAMSFAGKASHILNASTKRGPGGRLAMPVDTPISKSRRSCQIVIPCFRANKRTAAQSSKTRSHMPATIQRATFDLDQWNTITSVHALLFPSRDKGFAGPQAGTLGPRCINQFLIRSNFKNGRGGRLYMLCIFWYFSCFCRVQKHLESYRHFRKYNTLIVRFA